MLLLFFKIKFLQLRVTEPWQPLSASEHLPFKINPSEFLAKHKLVMVLCCLFFLYLNIFIVVRVAETAHVFVLVPLADPEELAGFETIFRELDAAVAACLYPKLLVLLQKFTCEKSCSIIRVRF